MKATTIFWRPINLFRGQEIRAMSRHTSLRGLNRILVKSALHDRTVHRNIEDRLLAGELTLPQLVRLAVMVNGRVHKVAEEILLEQAAFHARAVEELAGYLPDGKMAVTGSTETWGKWQVEVVETAFPRRQRAQQLLRRIGRLADDKLAARIREILAKAPRSYSKDRLTY
jgi:hypothetical protein